MIQELNIKSNMKYNVIFKCENGDFKIEECKKFFTENSIRETAENLEGLGCGRLKQIVIDIIEL